jgi:transposase
VAQQRAQWQAEQGAMEAERLVFLDEAGAKTNMTRLRARVKGGARAHEATPAGHWSTTTMISSLRLDGQTACMTLPGATDRAAFVEYVRRVLAPTLRPGDVVVMDNLSSHKDPRVRELIEARAASPVYLPAYSPDFNPIEKMWSKIKELLRAAKARTEEALLDALGKALEQVTPADAAGWFQSCGYVVS